MKQIHINRLARLTWHLRFGKLGHKVFDFRTYNSDITSNEGSYGPYGGICGTNGCQIGELPIVWPERFEFDCFGVSVKNASMVEMVDLTKNFFGIYENGIEYSHLFLPIHQNTIDYGGKTLNTNATQYEVADNNEAFIKTMSEKHSLEFPSWINDRNHTPENYD